MCTWNPETRKLFVEGLNIVNPGEHMDAKMSLEDFSLRPTTWIRQITVHTTGGHWPQKIIEGAGPGGHAMKISKSWRNSKDYGGAPFVIDFDGTVWLLIDPFKYQVFHATLVNAHSIGIEMCTRPDGSIYRATLEACVTLVKALCELCGIPFQIHSKPYVKGKIIERLKDGGRNVVGVFAHHQNAWVFPYQYKSIYATTAEVQRALANYPNGYANRGNGDCGDEFFVMARTAGALALDFNKAEELAYWKPVQMAINQIGAMSVPKYKLDVDGVYGPSLHAAMKKLKLWQYGGVFLEKPIS